MFTFDPIALTAPFQSAISTFQTEAQSPAAFGRVETKNFSVGTAAGVANSATGLAAQDGQRVEVGSQTKMMTATVILQLVGEGKINLDDKASKYLSADTIAGIANADVATVRQLLDMTSGINNFTDIVTPEGQPVFVKSILDNPDKKFTPDDGLDIVRGLPATVPVGTFNYSNTNYNLLGNIIQGITKEPLATTFEKRVFAVAAMAATDLVGTAAPGDLVRGFGTGPDGRLLDTTNAPWDKFAEGGVVSTPEDMIKFLKALLVDGKLLAPVQLAEMKSFMLRGDSPELKFGFGLGLVEFEVAGSGKYLGFNGGTLGFSSSTFMSLNTGAIGSVAVNFADAPASTDEGVLNLLKLIEGNNDWKAIDEFNAKSDVMKISSVSAASGTVNENGDFTIKFEDATLKLPLALRSVTTNNLTFSDGSVLVVGDNAVGTASDNRSNTIDVLKDFKSAASKDNQILGLGGDDRLSGGSGNDKISGGNGHDYLNGRDGDDTLFGGKGDDHMLGKNGNDTLEGGAGRDLLFGGSGNDTFVFTSLGDSLKGRWQRDVIADFNGDQDKIELTGIDTNVLLDLDQNFTFIGESGFTGQAGELHYFTEGRSRHGEGRTIIEGDVNGDGRADFQIELTGHLKLDAFDFIL